MEHFRLEHVADGAWAAIAIPATGAVANAGIVQAGNRTVVFDTLQTSAAARDLRAAAEGIAPVACVINSHWHQDHCNGNQAFKELPISSTARTRDLLAARGRNHIDSFRHDRNRRSEARAQGGTLAAREAELDHFEVVLPNQVFEDRLDVTSGALVETVGGGHTESDAFLWFEGVLFTGDLVTVRSHPWVGHGNIAKWIEILDILQARQPHVVVPGHGAVGSVEDIAALRRYLKGLLNGTATPVASWDPAGGHARNVQAVEDETASTYGISEGCPPPYTI